MLGLLSKTETVVASKGLFKSTDPVAVITSISPLDNPKASGSNTIRLRPNSSTVAVKSVPRIEIFAVGVLSLMFCLSIRLSLPVAKRTVPKAKVRAIFDFDGSGS